MIGTYPHSIDAKGRLFIPARLRDELGENFHVTLSAERDKQTNSARKYLVAYSNESWDSLMEKIKEKSKAEQKRMRTIFSHAAWCELDGQGRILLPQPLRTYAGLKKNVTIVGSGECVEFWDSDVWAVIDEIESSPEFVEDIYEEL